MNSVEATRLSETAPIAVRTLDHVTVVVGDLEASRTFYVDVLGMLEVPRPAFSFDGLWFQSGPVSFGGPGRTTSPSRSMTHMPVQRVCRNWTCRLLRVRRSVRMVRCRCLSVIRMATWSS